MIKALQAEIYKLTKNRGLKIYYIIMSILLVGESVYSYNLWKIYQEIFLEAKSYPQVLSMYWIGGDITSVFLKLYYLLLPIMSVLPFAVTYYTEIRTGYMKNACTRIGKKKYIISKYIVSFVTGGLACSCPLLINLLITSLYAVDLPQNVINLTTAVMNRCPWSDIFYDNPLLYAFIYICLAFIFGGLFAVSTMAIVHLCNNIFTYCIAGFLINVSGYYLLFYTDFLKNIPMAFLDPAQLLRGMTYGGIITTGVIMLIFSLVGMFIHIKKDVLR